MGQAYAIRLSLDVSKPYTYQRKIKLPGYFSGAYKPMLKKMTRTTTDNMDEKRGLFPN